MKLSSSLGAMRRKSGAPVEFKIEIDATAFERAASMLGTKVEGSWTSKSIMDALITPLFVNLNKEFGKSKKLDVSNIHEFLANGESVDISTKVSEFSSDDGPVNVKLVLGPAAPPGGAIFTVGFEADPGFAHMALPEADAELRTTLTPKWLKRTIKAAVLNPLLESLNQGQPKGARLTLGHVHGVLADGNPVPMTQKCLKLMLPQDGEPIRLTIKVGDERSSNGAGDDSLSEVSAGDEPAPKFSTAKRLSSRASSGGMRALSKVSGGATFHVLAGNLAVQAYVPKKGLKKSLQEALIDPFMHSLKKKSVGLAHLEKLGAARIEVDGSEVDVQRPAAEFVRRDDPAPTVIYFNTGEKEEEKAEERVAEMSLNYDPMPPATPSSPGTPATPATPADEEGESPVFGTMNSAAVARARAAARARAKARLSTSGGSAGSGATPLLIEGLGGPGEEKV